MSSWEAWPVSPLELRAVEQRRALFRARRGRPRAWSLKRFDAAPDFHHAGDVILDELQRRQHLGDALAGEILEIAGLEDADHVIADVLGERLLLLRA